MCLKADKTVIIGLKRRKAVFTFSGRIHVVIGLLFAVVLVPVSGYVWVAFGSLLPDIDHPKATLGRFNLLNRTRLFKHRGKCHTVIGSFCLSLPFYLVSKEVFGYVFAGCILHITADYLRSKWLKRRARKKYLVNK